MNSEMNLRRRFKVINTTTQKSLLCLQNEQGDIKLRASKTFANLPHRLLVVMTLLFLLGCGKPCIPCCSLSRSDFCSRIGLFARFLLLH
uniref:Uncharacterized protein n=1 Tax=Arundo donax TaxID=35708 RepID=A0A0A9CUU9_ARUDO